VVPLLSLSQKNSFIALRDDKAVFFYSLILS